MQERLVISVKFSGLVNVHTFLHAHEKFTATLLACHKLVGHTGVVIQHTITKVVHHGQKFKCFDIKKL